MLTFPTADTVDLFAGPGGWSVAAKRLGLRERGIEFDKAAHQTRCANGFASIRASVTDLGPANFPNATGLIASPPCQTFSAAGKGAGRAALDTVLLAVKTMGAGQTPDTSEWADERTALVLEPLRWAIEALALGKPYRWLAFEQVPTVLSVWQAMAEELRAMGYSVATGNLQAEQYGVPQTRKRAILIASLDHQVSLPTPLDGPPVRIVDALPHRTGWELHHWRGSGMLARYGSRPGRTETQVASTLVGHPSRLRWHHAGTDAIEVLSVDEARVIQSFPSGVVWYGRTRTEVFRQIGNAVPPLLAEAVLRSVI